MAKIAKIEKEEIFLYSEQLVEYQWNVQENWKQLKTGKLINNMYKIQLLNHINNFEKVFPIWPA